jgi:L,D-peptidoglycan transpeptidase YkuD (ErfK/YbiS/YcfS/YnhG family)
VGGIMKSLLVVGMALVSASGPVVSGPASGPAWYPTRLTHLGDARQVIVVTGVSMKSTYSTLHAFQLGADGKWREAFPAMPARNGYGGWQWAAQRIQDTGTTPIGTFRLTEAFGLAANPGSHLPYRKVDGNDYWVGDKKDPRTYNLFEPAASAKRTWRTAEAERLADYPTQYAHSVVIDFNRPAAQSVKWDANLGQYVTTAPAVIGRGSAVFLHINGKGSTAGCVSVTKANLLKLMRWLTPGAHPRIVMAPAADITRA